jgi:hypothetical protein
MDSHLQGVEGRLPVLRRRAVRGGLLAGLLLHSAAVAVVWRGWELGMRSVVLVWMDFPVSLLYLGFAGHRLLASSLVAGGVWWALLGALLSHWVGRVSARR